MTSIRTIRRAFLAFASAVLLAGCAIAAASPRTPHILVFSYSTGYRHASIEAGVAAIQALGAREGYVVEASEDPDIFAPGRLDAFDAIVLISTSSRNHDPSSEWFVGSRREALQAFVHRGGGIVAIHAASDSHYFWPWYAQMIGGRFERHPPGTPMGTARIVDPNHPATRGLPATQSRADEWYYFTDFNPEVHVLITVDPASIGQSDANPNPISWTHEFEGGRVFYTAMGHTPESYQEDYFMRHVAGGLRWALRREN